LDHQRAVTHPDGWPIPVGTAGAERRRAREEQRALDAERTLLLAELGRTARKPGGPSAAVRSRKVAVKHGEQLTRAEFDAVVDELRREQSMLDGIRNQLNGNIRHTTAPRR